MSRKRYMTQAEFAKHMGHHRSWVTRLKANGRLVLDPRSGKVDVEKTKALIEETRDPSKVTKPATEARKQQAAAARTGTKAAAAPRAPELDLGEPAESAKGAKERTYASARARREHSLAELAELDLKKARRQLIPTQEAVRAAEKLGASIRGRLERMPDELAPLLAETGAAELEAHRIVHDWVESVLADLSSAFKQYHPATENAA